MTANNLQIMCQKIISGGQTGVDRGALDACIAYKFPHGGWCPKGRLADDGIIDTKYNLKENDNNSYNSRTYKNVEEANTTLIISTKGLHGGTLLTKQIAERLNKPLLVLHPENSNSQDLFIKLIKFIQNNNARILNVAGPRQSEWLKGYNYSYQIISDVIKSINVGDKNPHY